MMKTTTLWTRDRSRLCMPVVVTCLVFAPVSGVGDLAERRERFGQQLFTPAGGFVFELESAETLPPLVWEQPEGVAELTEDPTIRTRWFDEQLHEVTGVSHVGRYYAYGKASGPGRSTLRRAVTCVAIPANTDLQRLARDWFTGDSQESNNDRQSRITDIVQSWRHTEEGAVELAALIDTGGKPEPRPGQWRMENATRHVRLKRQLMGRASRPPVVAAARRHRGEPAPVLRHEAAGQRETPVRDASLAAFEAALDEWYSQAKVATAIVVARNGVVALAKSYGQLDGKPVTINTPMLLHSAMKPLMGIQLAMYVDRGWIDLEQPIGNFLPDFERPEDRLLTFRACHTHLSGIHFPWPLAFSRLFYFRPWQDSMITHQPREWVAGTNYRYGVVGIILAVRSLELLSGRNYWDAMEREVFEPLGIRDAWPGGTGFSAEDLARIGVLLDNHGRYGEWELFSEQTYQAIVPTSLLPYFPQVDRTYGIGLQSYATRLGPGSYGHGGGCGTQLIVDPDSNLVFAMVRNEQGENYKDHLAEVTARLREWIEESHGEP